MLRGKLLSLKKERKTGGTKKEKKESHPLSFNVSGLREKKPEGAKFSLNLGGRGASDLPLAAGRGKAINPMLLVFAKTYKEKVSRAPSIHRIYFESA